jgi:hypothetical protein
MWRALIFSENAWWSKFVIKIMRVIILKIECGTLAAWSRRLLRRRFQFFLLFFFTLVAKWWMNDDKSHYEAPFPSCPDMIELERLCRLYNCKLQVQFILSCKVSFCYCDFCLSIRNYLPLIQDTLLFFFSTHSSHPGRASRKECLSSTTCTRDPVI